MFILVFWRNKRCEGTFIRKIVLKCDNDLEHVDFEVIFQGHLKVRVLRETLFLTPNDEKIKSSTSECDNDLDLDVNFQGHLKVIIFFMLESKRAENVTSIFLPT